MTTDNPSPVAGPASEPAPLHHIINMRWAYEQACDLADWANANGTTLGNDEKLYQAAIKLRDTLGKATHAAQPVPAPAVDERTPDSGHLAAAPEQQLPEPVAFRYRYHTGGTWAFAKESSTYVPGPKFEQQALYTADQLRTAIAAERERVRLEHARELVEAHREAFVGNIEALSKLDLDAMNAQPLLMAVQNWDISTGRARELLRCWVLGTFKPDMLPECGDELFAEADEPRDAWAKLQAELSTLRQHLAEALLDAERWRWWRANFGSIVVETEWRGGPAEGRYVRSVTLNPLFGPTDAASIDAAIDCAIAKQGDKIRPVR